MTDTRLEIEATFKCPTCGGTPYKLYRRNTPERQEVFTHVLWPTDRAILPPLDTKTLRCPKDETPLVRVPG